MIQRAVSWSTLVNSCVCLDPCPSVTVSKYLLWILTCFSPYNLPLDPKLDIVIGLQASFTCTKGETTLEKSSESENLSVMCNSLWPHGLYSPWNSPGQNAGVGSLSLPQGIFQTQGSNPRLPHCRWVLYQLSHQGSPRILEWVAYPFSRSSQPRNQTRVS